MEGGLLGDVLNPSAETGIMDDDEDEAKAVADDPSACWVMSRRRL